MNALACRCLAVPNCRHSLAYEEVYQVLLDLPPITSGVFSGWCLKNSHGFCGLRFYWEQMYFLSMLGVTDFTQWRKDEKDRLPQLAQYLFPGHERLYNYGDLTGVKDVTLTTLLLLPWLLHRYYHRSHERDVCSNIIRGCFEYALQGLGEVLVAILFFLSQPTTLRHV